MLDDLGDAMDRTEDRLIRETGHVVRVTEKAKSGGSLRLAHSLCAQVCAVAAHGTSLC